MNTMIKDIRKIKFGLSDAHTEGEDYPDLLSRGYINLADIKSIAEMQMRKN